MHRLAAQAEAKSTKDAAKAFQTEAIQKKKRELEMMKKIAAEVVRPMCPFFDTVTRRACVFLHTITSYATSKKMEEAATAKHREEEKVQKLHAIKEAKNEHVVGLKGACHIYFVQWLNDC